MFIILIGLFSARSKNVFVTTRGRVRVKTMSSSDSVLNEIHTFFKVYYVNRVRFEFPVYFTHLHKVPKVDRKLTKQSFLCWYKSLFYVNLSVILELKISLSIVS